MEGIPLNGFIFLYEKRELECGIGKWQRFGTAHSGTNRRITVARAQLRVEVMICGFGLCRASDGWLTGPGEPSFIQREENERVKGSRMLPNSEE